jgi:hypothetical protein
MRITDGGEVREIREKTGRDDGAPEVALTRASYRSSLIDLGENINDDPTHVGHVCATLSVARPLVLEAGPKPGKWVVLFRPPTVRPVARVGKPDHRGNDEERRDRVEPSGPSVGVSDLSHPDPQS